MLKYEDKGNRYSFYLEGLEKIVGTYYFKNELDKEQLIEEVQYGRYIKVEGTLKEPKENTIPLSFNYKKYLNNKDIYYMLEIDKIEFLDKDIGLLYKIKNYISKRIDKIDETGYMKAFILGDTTIIDNDAYSSYQGIGVTHLFALSGMHVGLLSSLILKLFKRLNSRIKYYIVIIILLLYGYIVGYGASISRSIIFFIIASINKMYKIDMSSFKILCLTTYILIFLNYKIIFDIAFLYSVISVFGIIIGSKYINDSNKLKQLFKLSLIAFLFSLPISLMCFYEVNGLSIIYNIFYVPYVTYILYPLCLISFMLPILYNLLIVVINIMEDITSILNNIDILRLYMKFNIWECLLYYLILISLCYKEKYKLFLILLFIILGDLLISYIDSSYYIYYFDVGQGDCSLIVMPYKKEIILIDTGGKISYDKQFNSEKSHVIDGVISFLKANSIYAIDKIILSHGDYDHIGDAIYLVESFKVDEVLFNCGTFNELEKELIELLDKKDISYYSCLVQIKVSDSKLYFLNNGLYDNENDNSIIVYSKFGNYKFLFMGDASIILEEDIIKKYNLNNIDVLKVGHHGSKTSSSKNFIDHIKPKYSIISVGYNNRYGHPSEDVLSNLDGSEVYRTDQHGSIVFKIKNEELQIDTYH